MPPRNSRGAFQAARSGGASSITTMSSSPSSSRAPGRHHRRRRRTAARSRTRPRGRAPSNVSSPASRAQLLGAVDQRPQQAQPHVGEARRGGRRARPVLVEVRARPRRRSRRPATFRNGRPLTIPTSIRRAHRVLRARASARSGRSGMPSVRARPLPEPTGTRPSAVADPSSPHADLVGGAVAARRRARASAPAAAASRGQRARVARRRRGDCTSESRARRRCRSQRRRARARAASPARGLRMARDLHAQLRVDGERRVHHAVGA